MTCSFVFFILNIIFCYTKYILNVLSLTCVIILPMYLFTLFICIITLFQYNVGFCYPSLSVVLTELSYVSHHVPKT